MLFSITVAVSTGFNSYASDEVVIKQQQRNTIYDDDRVEGEYVVTMKETTNEELLYELFSSNEVSYVEKITDRIFLIRLEIDPGPSEIYKSYLNHDNIEAIQPNFKYEVKPTDRSQMNIKE